MNNSTGSIIDNDDETRCSLTPRRETHGASGNVTRRSLFPHIAGVIFVPRMRQTAAVENMASTEEVVGDRLDELGGDFVQAYQDTFTKQQEHSDRSSGAATGVDLAARLLDNAAT